MTCIHLLLFPPLTQTKIVKRFSFTRNSKSIQPNSISSSSSQKLSNPQTTFFSDLIPFALTALITLTSPLPSYAIPSLKSSPLLPTTPFSQSKNLPTGLEDGKIRPCPSVNPGCISTNPKSSSFAFPWEIPQGSIDNAIQKLEEAILKTQKIAKIMVRKDMTDGHYLQAEIDSGFGRDVVEFLVKGDVVLYRCMATKVTYVYPFTTALGDSKGQEERLKKINEYLGWLSPDFDLGE
ncbi:thylakoid lumenal 17.9 kDa protein, chloroplastic-like [Impatiens glandulifera]|uniref:thylakoid lumenal 17.9 kDa protein, chloroplastic-like n=1 Tax=Impatiens glandulifera TaxID=253017 RepID=UPI001FB13D49|nr:thylakoid lumenal 17.9 kDa protein, chloroplastic-like [Impatiens glandulifera]